MIRHPDLKRVAGKMFLPLILMAVVSSCDYWGDYFYYVENGLQTDTVTILAHRGRYDAMKDSVFIILPHERKLVEATAAGAFGQPVHPPDDLAYFYHHSDRFEVFINGVKLEKNLWDRQYWEYTTKRLEGTYLLLIDERIVDETNN